MMNNIGKAESTFRFIAGLILLALFIVHVLTGVVGLILFSISGVLLISGISHTCPLTYLVEKKIKKAE